MHNSDHDFTRGLIHPDEKICHVSLFPKVLPFHKVFTAQFKPDQVAEGHQMEVGGVFLHEKNEVVVNIETSLRASLRKT
jgi:hypothetical protein